jgi:Na+-driven multidrug efflux pump
MSLSSLLNSYLVAENFRKILFITSFVAMLGNVLLNLILIPKYGIVGSAWATFISYILGPMSLIFFKDMRKKIFEILRLN